MSALMDRQRQAHDLVRLREVRMRAAANALAEARAATLAAERMRAEADSAADIAASSHNVARAGLAADPAEAERLLAVLDQRRFQRSIAIQALADARDEEHKKLEVERGRRTAVIVARARHDVLADQLGDLARRIDRQDEERTALDAEDIRRFR
ncbi:hypothetical protein M0208_05695 [Sphingomonas sp. SUN019]|uniref:hypothetical protein n=1 Tax=Sphingomonas sp. SUN019 TaxID=2937788 RepID=UPI0021644E04|nr:hypothetical protein [Sphingomonas sp. SUN019]UVO50037.1 hypothetical protein M0208_05695 [Sphingomonas sp. SUN019]